MNKWLKQDYIPAIYLAHLSHLCSAGIIKSHIKRRTVTCWQFSLHHPHTGKWCNVMHQLMAKCQKQTSDFNFWFAQWIFQPHRATMASCYMLDDLLLFYNAVLFLLFFVSFIHALHFLCLCVFYLLILFCNLSWCYTIVFLLYFISSEGHDW